MKVIALIPARYAATRFPGKLMQPLRDKTVIRHTYENTKASGLFDDVIVVTDSALIQEEIMRNGGHVQISHIPHESGSDRIGEVAKNLQADIVVNVQGDEPFVEKEILQKLLQAFEEDENTRVASLMHPITASKDINNPNYVKVIVDKFSNALYFSRSAIPFQRNKNTPQTYYKHIGIYAFRKEALLQFTTLSKTPLEKTEMLEQLRYLENGISIKMVSVAAAPLSIDTPEDLAKAQALLNR